MASSGKGWSKGSIPQIRPLDCGNPKNQELPASRVDGGPVVILPCQAGGIPLAKEVPSWVFANILVFPEVFWLGRLHPASLLAIPKSTPCLEMFGHDQDGTFSRTSFAT